MTAEQFRRAYALATSKADLSKWSIDALYGCGLRDFNPVVVPIEVVARHIRWQCYMLNGEIDAEEVSECHKALVYPSRRVEIVDEFRCPHCGVAIK